jgi:hypothetical protein
LAITSGGLSLPQPELANRTCSSASQILHSASKIGFDIGKNTFHLVGLDKRGTSVTLSPFVLATTHLARSVH